MGKVYRTANGKIVDFDALLLKNEHVPAVGSNVNARGDEIDSKGNIVRERAEIMQEYNKLNTMVPTDGPIPQKAEPDVLEDEDAS